MIPMTEAASIANSLPINIASIGTAAAITSMILFDFSSTICDSSMVDRSRVKKNSRNWRDLAGRGAVRRQRTRRFVDVVHHELAEAAPAAAARWQDRARSWRQSSRPDERRRSDAARRDGAVSTDWTGGFGREQALLLCADIALGSRSDQIETSFRSSIVPASRSCAADSRREIGRRRRRLRPPAFRAALATLRADATENAAEKQRE